MAAREHSRFVHFVLPWIVGVAGALLYLVTLNRWVSLDGIDLVAKVAAWDWNTVHLGPITLLVTWPFRWLPPSVQTLALNALSAALGGLVLGLLAKCIVLLPHDRTREQRQRERNDFGFLTHRLAWVPAVGAAGLLAFQLTFWEHATALTGEMINLSLFAFCVYCFLRSRVMQEDGYLALLSFTFGAAAANDWGLIAFCPLFFVAILWTKGIAFFEAKFLIRTTLAGLAGTLFYLVQPIALKMTGQADGSFFELFRAQLGIQRQILFSFPRPILAFASLSSILPVFVMGIRWPTTFGDMSAAGAAVTNFMFRVVHVALLAFCVWVMFDPPFSPRQIGMGLPFLTFYFLTALSIGYLAGYVILVFGQEPERKIRRTSEGMIFFGKAVSAATAVVLVAAALGLAVYNRPAIRGQNGNLVRDLASTLTTLPAGNSAIVSDDNVLLMLAVGMLHEKGHSPDPIALNTQLLKRHVYQRHLERKYGHRWPALVIEQLSDPLGDEAVLRQMIALSFTNRIFYLHPSFGYYFEPYRLVPTNALYQFEFQSTNTFRLPPLPDDRFDAVHAEWKLRKELLVDNPVIARLLEKRVAAARSVGAHYSRAFNGWGVELQRRGRLPEAREFFTAAKELSPDNLAAVINLRFNEQLATGRTESIPLSDDLTDRLGRFRDLPTFLSLCGPVDEPSFCFNLGRVFADGSLNRQAAQQFARAIELQPKGIEMRLWLANACLGAQLPEEVLRVVGEARGLGQELSLAQQSDLASLEAWAQFRLGDLARAESVLDDARRRFPERLELLQTLADIYVAANRTNAALAAIDQLVERRPGDFKPLITKSAIQMQSGAVDEAIKTLDVVLGHEPGFFPALVNRALAYSRLGRLDDAERDYLKLLELAPKMNSVYYHLGEIDFQRGNGPSARQHYRRFLDGAVPGSPEARAAQQRLDDIAAGRIGG